MSWIKTLDLKNMFATTWNKYSTSNAIDFFLAQMSVTSNEKKAAVGKPKYLLFTV